jgi:hypothetical protein
MCELEVVAAREAEAMTWDLVRDHIREAVYYRLRNWAGGRDQWKNATPEQIAEAVTVHAMAAIAPVLSGEEIRNGVAMMRATLARAGIDPAGLPWFCLDGAGPRT